MNCFNHETKQAIGICKSCGKGLCKECISEVPNGIACKDSCEDRVNLINSMIDRNPKMVALCKKMMSGFYLFSIAVGLVFIFFGYKDYIDNNDSIFSLILGSLVAVFGVFGLFFKKIFNKNT